jgi:hypothetical protein
MVADLVWDFMTECRKRRDSTELRACVERRSHGLEDELSADVRTKFSRSDPHKAICNIVSYQEQDNH